VKHGNGVPGWIRKPSIAGLCLLMGSVVAWAQTSSSGPAPSQGDSMAAAVQELQRQVGELRAAVGEMRSETAQYRAENAELRHQVEALRLQTAAGAGLGSESQGAAPAQAANTAPASLEQRVASLEESSQLQNSKLNDQYQTKVESASKYRVRLSGIVLMNLFSNRGTTDTQDVPTYVTGPNVGSGNFGATLRQSEIGLEVFGPHVAGARISGSLQADFGGGFADTWNGVDSGVFRLRTASMHMDWQHTSLVVGQDDLFISPLSPSTFASLAVPGFTYAGNLWAWTPQVRVEHRFAISDDQNITVQGGILDNLTGEFPASSYFRSSGPGENSGQPAYAFRTAWSSSLFGQPLVVGGAGYYGRQDWGFDHYADGWAGMVDLQIPLSSRVSFSGEFYRGKAIGGLGGGISRSVVYNGNPALASTAVIPLDSVGGWSQIKVRANNRLEFNAGFGLDNPTASEVRAGAAGETYVGPMLVQNRSALVNFIFRPRSNLLFSAEYRHLQSLQIYDVNNSAQQINVMMGVLF
jgi:hypothetical protein